MDNGHVCTHWPQRVHASTSRIIRCMFLMKELTFPLNLSNANLTRSPELCFAAEESGSVNNSTGFRKETLRSL